ncbi:hypothetical protein [Mycoplasmopsis adleri]|uniref:hypothetical protein n=1 Tax=Mycoplasmopsis adleri TaxID=51362 RepID=UPI003873C01B
MDNLKKVNDKEASNIYGGGAILSTILAVTPVIISAVSSLVPLFRSIKSKRGEVNKNGTVKWDDSNVETVYKPVYVAY